MSSVIFQPLLHDPLGWKSSNSTYNDHYKWKKYRSTSKDKKISTYGQQYQRQLQKQQCLPLTTNGEQTINRVIVVKNNEENQERPISYRYSPSKTPVYIVEYKQRPMSADAVTNFFFLFLKINFFFSQDTTHSSRVSQRPPTAPPAVEGK
jgi:hypothetical protein